MCGDISVCNLCDNLVKASDVGGGCFAQQTWFCTHPLRNALSNYEEGEPGRLLRGGCEDQVEGEPHFIEFSKEHTEELVRLRKIHGEYSQEEADRAVEMSEEYIQRPVGVEA